LSAPRALDSLTRHFMSLEQLTFIAMMEFRLSLFRCNQKLHMDFGFLTLFDYV
jgi:hypothetical protein